MVWKIGENHQSEILEYVRKSGEKHYLPQEKDCILKCRFSPRTHPFHTFVELLNVEIIQILFT